MSLDFDEPIDRRGTHCVKWDMMEAIYGVPKGDGIAMWVADMEFPAAPPIQDALRDMLEHGVYGYFGDDARYREAIRWWMGTRHDWDLDPAAIFTTHGLVNGVALCVDTWTEPGDAVALLTPVYHAFARVIRAAGRRVTECEMPIREGAYAIDREAILAALTGAERMLILCSPHNPGGRVWSRAELETVAEICRERDLILVSDEIHHDLVFPGAPRHVPMTHVEGIEDRLVMLTAATKTFNIAGAHVGNVIVPDAGLRARFAARMAGLGISPNSFGLHMVTAAYSEAGAAWLDALMPYLDGNRRLLDETVAAIPGVSSMPLEATYLSWLDFSGTGMGREEFTGRVERDARLAVNHGPSFGAGGESWLRLNIAAPRAQVAEACARLRAAFSDLQ